jgi:aspartyl-tRNA(Asn)/glutamyl-tRNA(Gln) amidotransferase subunit C
MISKEEVLHIAKLARLELTEQEIEKMQKDLSSILDYFDILKRAPKAVADRGWAAGRPTSDSLRKDEAMPKPASLSNNLVVSAPANKDGYIKVKQVL